LSGCTAWKSVGWHCPLIPCLPRSDYRASAKYRAKLFLGIDQWHYLELQRNFLVFDTRGYRRDIVSRCRVAQAYLLARYFRARGIIAFLLLLVKTLAGNGLEFGRRVQQCTTEASYSPLPDRRSLPGCVRASAVKFEIVAGLKIFPTWLPGCYPEKHPAAGYCSLTR